MSGARTFRLLPGIRPRALVLAVLTTLGVPLAAVGSLAATAKPAEPAPSPIVAPVCGDMPKTIPDGNLKLSVTIDPASSWKQMGGDVIFTITGADFTPQGAQIVTCYRWAWDDPRNTHWVQAPMVRLLDNAGALTGGKFSSAMPDLGREPHSWWDRVTMNAKGQAFTALGFVPFAEFRVIATSSGGASWKTLDVTQYVGVTNQLFAGTAAALVALIVFTTLFLFGKARQVPGGGSPILQVISNREGVASLSQLQITIWAFVVGASAVYVMSLSGNLIEISQGTLVLLGISGVTTLGTKLQTATSQAQGVLPAPPGVVVALHPNEPAGEAEVRLTWSAPIGGGPPDRYIVQYRRLDTDLAEDWTTATANLTAPGFRITGLRAASRYALRVAATNDAGPGAWAPEVTVRTAEEPAGAIGPVEGFRPADLVKNTSLSLSWQPTPAAAFYTVQYRRHDSDDAWQRAQVRDLGADLARLQPNTLYDLRIAAAAAPAPGSEPTFGRWRTLTVATTGPRVPRWSDLVVDGDGAVNEIDVTRVQMLFFTMIVAIFVLMRVVTSSEIPVIPDSFLLLMGISNGVYLGAKFISR